MEGAAGKTGHTLNNRCNGQNPLTNYSLPCTKIMIMKLKIEKTLKYAAVLLFVGVLLVNVKMSLDNPFSYMAEAAIAEETTNGGAPTCTAGGCNATSCSYSGEITVLGSGVTVTNSVSCTNNTFACCHITAYCFDAEKCNDSPGGGEEPV